MKLKILLLLIVISFGVGALNYSGPSKKIQWAEVLKELDKSVGIPSKLNLGEKTYHVKTHLTLSFKNISSYY